jgi:hypothetical protein
MLEFLLSDDGLVPPLQTVPNEKSPRLGTREEIFALANTAHMLDQLGADTTVSEDDEEKARDLFTSGRTPNTYEKQLPGVMLKLNALLTEYDYSLLDDARRIRNFVTNRLLEETENPDPKIRLRAYELLGKITEVGLFTERAELTIKHKPTEELESLLRDKLQKLMPRVINEPVTEAEHLIATVRPEDIL